MRLTDAWAILIYQLRGERQAFPAALGSLGPELLRFIGSDACPEAFPDRSPGEGAGSWGRLRAEGAWGTSGLGHSHRKHTASKRGKLTELWLWAEEGLSMGTAG